MKKILPICLSVCLCLAAIPVAFAAGKTDFVESDGVKIEYAIHGLEDGEPLVLLPPNGGDMHAFDGNVLPELTKHFKVITVSPRGTGNSERGSGKLTFDVMSQDLLNLLDSLGIEKTNIFGFSDGGNLGLVFTHQHQDRVNKLAVMGANINPFGTKPTNQLGIVAEYIILSIKAAITGNSEDALKRDIQGLMVDQPTLTFKDISTINVPVLNIYGQHDMFLRAHSMLITKSIPNAKGLMVKGGGHSSCFDYTDTVLLPALLEFYSD